MRFDIVLSNYFQKMSKFWFVNVSILHAEMRGVESIWRFRKLTDLLLVEKRIHQSFLWKILCKSYYVRRAFSFLFLHLQIFSFLWHHNLFCYIMKYTAYCNLLQNFPRLNLKYVLCMKDFDIIVFIFTSLSHLQDYKPGNCLRLHWFYT